MNNAFVNPVPTANAQAISFNGFIQKVFLHMSLGLAISGVVAWFVYQNQQVFNAINSPWMIAIALGTLGLVVLMSFGINKFSTVAMTTMFYVFSILEGALLSGIFVVYDLGSIGVTFAITAGMFVTLAVIGWVTKADLSKFGVILFVALIGLIIASVVNIFWASGTLYWIVTYAGILIFSGLIVFDMNKLRQIHEDNTMKSNGNLAILGALSLYLDFINLFLFLLRIFGNRN